PGLPGTRHQMDTTLRLGALRLRSRRVREEAKMMKIASGRGLMFAAVVGATAARAAGGAGPEKRTGCPSPGHGGENGLPQEKTKRTITVIPTVTTDLAPHAYNHRVTITGTLTKEQDKEILKASAIQHLDLACFRT